MNLVERVDGFQRRHSVVGYPIAVVYKFFDDQGAYLAAIITYYAFIAIFPLLLIASSVLGFVLQGDDELQEQILNSALSQFPIVGEQLGRPEGLQGSTSAVVVGAVAALYGVLGLGNASQHALNVAWAVPRNSRPNPLLGRLRSLVLLAAAGASVLAVTLVTTLGTHLPAYGPEVSNLLRSLLNLGAVAVNAAVLTLLFRYGAERDHSLRAALPGAIAVALMWQSLQFAGAYYVERVINRASTMNGTFALVLGLVALIFVAANMGVIGVQVNVVYASRLYPRALLTPFTDNIRLTEADRRAYTAYATAQRHKGFERITVEFDQRADNGRVDQPDPLVTPGEHRRVSPADPDD